MIDKTLSDLLNDYTNKVKYYLINGGNEYLKNEINSLYNKILPQLKYNNSKIKSLKSLKKLIEK